MKFFVVLLSVVFALLCTVRGTPIRHEGRVLVNRPSREDMINARVRRDQHGVKGRPVIKPDPMTVRKGEYVCGNKICKLQPGEIPKQCVGCQYPIKLLPNLSYYNSDN